MAAIIKKPAAPAAEAPATAAPAAAPAAEAPRIPAPVNQGRSLSNKSDDVTKPARSKDRDYDAEARGKTLCALYQACLTSPEGPARCSTEEEFNAWSDRQVDRIFKKIFPNG